MNDETITSDDMMRLFCRIDLQVGWITMGVRYGYILACPFGYIFGCWPGIN